MAEKYLIKQAQKEAFSEEIFNLSNGLPLDKESRILKYTPVMFPDGIIRSDTRFNPLLPTTLIDYFFTKKAFLSKVLEQTMLQMVLIFRIR